ncbi:MAG TPA: hypothetical protein VH764_15825, partial [Gemmatimonadales bacterium]
SCTRSSGDPRRRLDAGLAHPFVGVKRRFVGRALTNRLELAAECIGESDASFRERTVVCSPGAREEVVAHYTLLAALGSGAGGSAADRPHIAFYLGLQSVR